MDMAELIWMIVGLVLTLLVFSYLLGDNLLFRFVSYLFVGVTAGYVTTIVIYQVIWPRIVLPLFNGTMPERIMAVVPLLLGVLLLFKLFPGAARLGSIPMGFLVGLGAALAVGGAILGTLFGQVGGAVAMFDFETTAANGGSVLLRLAEAVVLLIGMVTTLIYFHFSTRKQRTEEQRRPGWMEVLAQVGQVFIAITFGALFAGVYLAAIAALVDRIDFIRDVVLRLGAL